jgi:hypothetical protein
MCDPSPIILSSIRHEKENPFRKTPHFLSTGTGCPIIAYIENGEVSDMWKWLLASVITSAAFGAWCGLMLFEAAANRVRPEWTQIVGM